MKTHTKYVPWRQLKIGQEIKGVKYENTLSSFQGFVRAKNIDKVVIAMWQPDSDQTKQFDARTTSFEVPITEAEFRRNNNPMARKCVKALETKLTLDRIGYHEMANSWLSNDPWELACELRTRKYKLIGICTEIQPKRPLFDPDGDPLDIGICCEDADGDRFWCHYWADRIPDIIALQKAYEECPQKAAFDPHEAMWQIKVAREND